MMETRAAVVHPGSNSFTWERVELEEPRPDEVLVRVVGVGICHTDLSTRDERLPTPLPAVLGHEGAGVVESVGAAVTKVRPGDQVLLSFSSCGGCGSCRRGHPAYCETFLARNFGGGRPDGSTPIRASDGSLISGRFFGQSSFAEHTIADERSVVRVEAANEDELAVLAPMGCGIQTGAGAVLNELRPKAGDSIAVFGAGDVGLSAVLGAALTGATRIIAIDIVPSRLALAREFGATHTIDGKNEDTAERLFEITDGAGLHHAVEASGVPALLNQAVETLAPHGSVAVVGAPQTGATASFDVNFLLNGRVIRGVTEGDSDLVTFLPGLVDLYRMGRLPFDAMVRTYSPDQINEAAADAEAGEALKPVLRFT